MMNLPATAALGWGACCLLALASPAGAQDADTSPARLLNEAQALVRGVPLNPMSYSDSVVGIRVAHTMWRHGMRAEALAAAQECRRRSAQNGPVLVALQNEMTVELCRLLVLLGETAQAETLAETAEFRGYASVARYMMARAALEEMGDARLAEALVRHPSLLQPEREAKPDETPSRSRNRVRAADPWRRACARLAVQMGNLDLARELIGAMDDPFWQSAAMVDLAVALARAGERETALKTVCEAPDTVMALVGLGRVASALPEPLAPALDALRQSAEKVADAGERDYALGTAVSRLAAAGRPAAAARVAEQIEGPVARVRAECEVLTPDRLAAVQKAVDGCPEADQPLLWEVVGIACARHGMAPAALDAAQRIGNPWQRCRAQGTAARTLAGRDRQADAAKLAEAAAASAAAVADDAWRVRAHLRAALDADRAGVPALAHQQLAQARGALARVTEPDLRPGLVVGVAEVLSALKRGPARGGNRALQEFAAEALKADPPPVIRERLLPLLAAGGAVDLAAAECERAGASAIDSHQQPLRAVVYRLARQGDLARAKACAEKLSGLNKADAYASIALAQLPPAASRPVGERAVGVSLHGSWAGWIARLERMGARWDLMPFTAPHVLGAAGLAATYSALGYPGTNDHRLEVGVAGSENLRDFFYGGGGYLGICAGCNLTPWQRSTECDQIGMRGQGPHQVQIRKTHLVSLGLPPVVTITRMNGPFLIPRPGCDVVGWYDTEDRYAALVAQDYGYGRVAAFSPHPESGSGMDARGVLYTNALNWAITGLP
ncbi:MAG: hypothetical protein HY321_12120 [Armatimonadetes bacterium]|nr:hypothetical protein [Armatimonadota bacterium]